MTKLTSLPLAVTTAWIEAVEAADCQCQCTATAEKHTHVRTDGRCRTTQGVAGGRLHLLEDGSVLCHKCANHHEKTAQAATPEPDPTDLGQESLFDLLA